MAQGFGQRSSGEGDRPVARWWPAWQERERESLESSAVEGERATAEVGSERRRDTWLWWRRRGEVDDGAGFVLPGRRAHAAAVAALGGGGGGVRHDAPARQNSCSGGRTMATARCRGRRRAHGASGGAHRGGTGLRLSWAGSAGLRLSWAGSPRRSEWKGERRKRNGPKRREFRPELIRKV